MQKITRCFLPPAFREVLPAVYAPAASGLEREPPPPSRRADAVRPVPQRHRPHPGAGNALLEVRICERKSGCRQGNNCSMTGVFSPSR